MTTVQRLADKGVLAVDRSVYPHQYWAPLSQADFTKRAVGQILDELLSDFAKPALAHLEAGASDSAPALPQRVVDHLKRQRNGEEP